VRVQEVRWDRGGTERADNCIFFYGNGNHKLGTGFSVHKRVILTVKGVKFVSDRISYCRTYVATT
jgi:hypothetical protein